MSAPRGMRRAIAVLRWEGEAEPVVRVGGRSLHQYWAVLAPYFRDVLLPPHRRTDENVVSWAWQEPVEVKGASTAELRSLRKRLEREQEFLAENLSRAEGATGDTGAQGRGAGMQGLAVAMGNVIAALVAADDAELGSYVCRTEVGLRLHSWGASRAARVEHPDTVRDERGVGERGADATPVNAEMTSAPVGTRRRRRGLAIFGVGAAMLIAVGWGIWGVVGNGAEEGAGKKRAEATPRGAPRDDEAVRAAVDESGKLKTRVAVKTGEDFSGRTERARDQGGTRTRLAEIDGARSELVVNREPEAAAASVAQVGRVTRSPVKAARPEAEARPLPMPSNARPDGTNPPSGARLGGAIEEGDSVKIVEQNAAAALEVRELGAKLPTQDGKPTGRVTVEVDAADAAAAIPPEELKVAAQKPIDDAPREHRAERETKEVRERAREVPVVEEANGRTGAVRLGAVAVEARWEREMTVRLPQWRTRMLVDVILPTRPVRLGAATTEKAQPWRDRALAELRGQMPATLREPRMRGGIRFEVGPGVERSGLRWREIDGAREVRAALHDGRAELGWDAAARMEVGRWTLEHAMMGVLAEVRVAADVETAVVSTAEGVRVYQWFSVVIADDDRGARWSWRRLAETTLPEGAVAKEDGEGAEWRVEIAFTRVTRAVEPLAFFDRESGWALVSEARAMARHAD